LEKHIGRKAVRATGAEALQALKISTCCFHCSVVDLMLILMEDHDLLESPSVDQQIPEVASVVEDHSHGVAAVAELAAGEKMAEAYSDSLGSQYLQKKHFDVSNGLAQVLAARLGYSLLAAAEYNMEGRTVFVDAQHRLALMAVDVRSSNMAAAGWRMEEKGCGHRAMRCSAKRDAAAAVVLDP
jgi:hypothetical protein